MRTFILGIEPAISVCEEMVLVQEELADPLHQLGVEALWTPAEELRVNLLHLDGVEPDAMRLLLDEVRMVARTEPELELSVKAVRLAPDEDHPRLVLAEMDSGGGILRLRDRVTAAAQQLGLPVEGAWVPVIRLGRLRTPSTFMPLRGVLREGMGASSAGRSRELVAWELIRRASAPWSRVLARAALGTGQ